MTQEALKLALEALAVRFSEGWHEGIKIDASDIMLLNEAAQALAQPEQEPWCMKMNGCKTKCKDCPDEPPDICCQQYDTCLKPCTPRGVHLAQRTWVGLTDDEMEATFIECGGKWNGDFWKIEDADFHPFLRTIEAKLKDKNCVG